MLVNMQRRCLAFSSEILNLALKHSVQSAAERYENAIEMSLADKSVPEDAVGKIELEKS